MSYATSPDGTQIWWTEIGSGPPLLLISGFGGSHTSWVPLAQQLQQHFRVIMLDQRGTGKSQRPRGRYRYSTMIQDAIAVLDAAGVERTAAFGVSMGGLVLQEFLLTHPERLSHAVLGCTQPPRAKTGDMKGLLQLIFIPLMSRKRVERLAAKYIVHPSTPPETITTMIDAETEKTPLRTTLRTVWGQIGHIPSGALSQVTTPTLVIHGSDDLLVPVVNAHALHNSIPGSELVILPDAAHEFRIDNPQATVEALVGHLLS